MKESFIQWRRRVQKENPGARIDTMEQSGRIIGARAFVDGVCISEWEN